MINFATSDNGVTDGSTGGLVIDTQDDLTPLFDLIRADHPENADLVLAETNDRIVPSLDSDAARLGALVAEYVDRLSG